MSSRQAGTALDVDALLEHGKAIPPCSSDARARVLARARSTVAAPPLYRLEPLRERRVPIRVVYAVALVALVAGIAGAAVALKSGLSRTPERAFMGDGSDRASVPSAKAPPAPPLQPVAPPPAVPESAPAASNAARPQRARRTDEAELELLRAAHSAYQSRQFANALVLVGEHARRYPNGLLAEEREALRVRSLAGAGRTEEARRAAVAF
ncbi:MAG TPA: hypothetical protein VNN72_10645, partial [Polyangiaceae bacterium]|nr:hypothetical protein [Polyangiaceae bacterium]